MQNLCVFLFAFFSSGCIASRAVGARDDGISSALIGSDLEGMEPPLGTFECPHRCCLIENFPGCSSSPDECGTRQRQFWAVAASLVLLSVGFFLLCCLRMCSSKVPVQKSVQWAQSNTTPAQTLISKRWKDAFSAASKEAPKWNNSVKEAAPNWRKSVVDVKMMQLEKTHLHLEHAKLLADAGAKYKDTIGGPLGPQDVLLIVDMQNDFLPEDVAPLGGRFGVAEGGSAADVIVQLIRKATAAKAKIVATRDYHPKSHCSFNTNGGVFPPHCIQGHAGSFLYPPIENALKQAKADGADVSIVFKGFVSGVDSFGGFAYSSEYFGDRQLGDPNQLIHECCALDWTGCFCLPCSNIDEDLNAPPDVCAVFSRETLKERLGTVGRLFGTGLAMDFCVMDSLLNAAVAGVAQKGAFLVADAARAAYIPGIGKFGTGFLSDPSDLVQKMSASSVHLVNSDLLLS